MVDSGSALRPKKDEPITIRPPSARGTELEQTWPSSQVRPRYVCPTRLREPLIDPKLAEHILGQLLGVRGVMAASIIDCRRGEAMASSIVDARIAAADLAAGAARLHREALCGEPTEAFEEALVVLSGQFRIMRPLSLEGCVAYLIVDSVRGRMGLARYTMASACAAAGEQQPSGHPGVDDDAGDEPGLRQKTANL